MNYQVVRTNLSPYQHPDFMQMEKQLLEELPGLEYRTLEDFRGQQEVLLITNTHTRLSSLPKALLDQTRLIVHPNSGYDNFNATSEQAIWEQIPLVIGHTIRAQAVAEYSLACLFEAVQELPQHLSWNKERRWNRTLMQDLSVLVFGYGHIGKIVAHTLKALGMKITIVDPYIEACPFPCCKTWQELEVDSFQVVISCMGLNHSSRKLFNQAFFARAHPELIFINGARGALVDEQALKDFLLAHPEAFAFLDVFEHEPFGEEWHHFPQVWKTSHIAGVHKNLDQGILKFEYAVLKDFLEMGQHEFALKYQKELLQNKRIKGELI